MEYLHINLQEKHAQDAELKENIQKFVASLDQGEHPQYKAGQTIEFIAGYNEDIKYTAKITAIDAGRSIYVEWDCYWFPIRDEAKRQIKIIE